MNWFRGAGQCTYRDNIQNAEPQQPIVHHDVPRYYARRSESDLRSEHSTTRRGTNEKKNSISFNFVGPAGMSATDSTRRQDHDATH